MNWMFRLIVSIALFALATEVIVDSFCPIQSEISSEDSNDENKNPLDTDSDDNETEEVKIKVKSIFVPQFVSYHHSFSVLNNNSETSVYHFPKYRMNHLSVPFYPPERV